MNGNMLILGIVFVILGIYFIITFLKEKAEKYSLVQGKIVQILKSRGRNGFSYTPIIEYQYEGNTYKTEHRISASNPKWTYDVNDRVELRVYEHKPDKAIINSTRNIYAPLVIGICILIIGGTLIFVSCFVLN